MSELHPIQPPEDAPPLTLPTGQDLCLRSLPPTRRLTREEREALDAALGIRPAALREAYRPPHRTRSDVLGLLLALAVGGTALAFLFPWERFFRPLPRRTSMDLTIQVITPEDVQKRGGLEQLSPMEQAHFSVQESLREGDLEGALKVCQYELGRADRPGRVPPADWTDWRPVWRLYFRTLHAMGAERDLQREALRLLKYVPQSLDGRFYYARSLLRGFPDRPGYKHNSPWRGRAETAIRALQEAMAQLQAMENAGGTVNAEEKATFLRLLAKAHYVAWAAGNYQEDDHPDVSEHRDRALALLDRLGDRDSEALDLRRRILQKILDQWNRYLEGREMYRGRLTERDTVVADLNATEALLESLRNAPPEP